ncbi:MAG TPA: DNA-3-methyladenine glycosylase 2 family protein [Actinomycetota bacterium]|nr:DNA-3-methyladenine glycosylase 2 family protein [Actinomycetota bacterium]
MEALETVVRPRLPIWVGLSLAALRHGPRDPTVRIRRDGVWRATRTPDGPATVRYEQRDDEVRVCAWGPGAEHAIAKAPEVLGSRDSLDGWNPSAYPAVREIDRRMSGLRMVATGAVFEAIVPTVLEQKITSEEAHESWRRMAWRWGEEAPGPDGVRLPPSPAKLAGEPYYAYHRLGVEKKRTDIVRRLADRAVRVEEAKGLGRQRLEAFPGIGAWTSAKVAQVAWADADAVPVGDYHLAPVVVYTLTGRRGGDDDAMLELLEPFAPHRGRAALLLKMAGGGPPRRAPRARLRDLTTI